MAEAKGEAANAAADTFENFVSAMARDPKAKITTDDGGKNRVPPSGSVGAKCGPKPGTKRKTKG